MNSQTYIIFGVFLLGMAAGNVQAGTIVERAVRAVGDSSEGSGIIMSVFTTFSDLVGRIPIIGGVLKSIVLMMGQAAQSFESITNNVLGRIFAALVPCTISLGGIQCSGILRSGGWGNLIKGVIGSAPALILPPPFGELARIAISILLSGI